MNAAYLPAHGRRTDSAPDRRDIAMSKRADEARRRGMRRGIVIASAIAVGALVGLGLQLWSNQQSRVSLGSVASIGGPFSLIDQKGRPVTDQAFRGKLMLVYFGYTYCPDVCPTELGVMTQALDELGDAAKQVAPIFISIDPERDTPEVLATYLSSFYDGFVGLTGSVDQVAAAARAYRVYYARAKDSGRAAGDYLVDHSGFVYLMDREGTYRAHFRPDTSPEAMAARIKALL